MQYYLTHLKPTVKDQTDDHACLTMLCHYLCTLSLLQDRPFSSYRSSMIAASCLFYAHQLLNSNATWNHRYVQVTSYTQADLQQCTSALGELYSKTYHQDQATSSVLRRYLKAKKENDSHHGRVKDIIHHGKMADDDDEDELLDLTLDEMDEEGMSVTEHL